MGWDELLSDDAKTAHERAMSDTPAEATVHQKGIEAAAKALQGRYLGRDDWRTFVDEAQTAIDAYKRECRRPEQPVPDNLGDGG